MMKPEPLTPEQMQKTFESVRAFRSYAFTDAQKEFTQAFLAARDAQWEEMLEEQCQHRIVDARNPVVKSGYICADCGALFRSLLGEQQ